MLGSLVEAPKGIVNIFCPIARSRRVFRGHGAFNNAQASKLTLIKIKGLSISSVVDAALKEVTNLGLLDNLHKKPIYLVAQLMMYFKEYVHSKKGSSGGRPPSPKSEPSMFGSQSPKAGSCGVVVVEVKAKPKALPH
ncbi:hypothetical protein GUJ93_ZPchr0010g7855 [Zizania palustris]|uniref:Uncharacterized protein n=1 Tax=Zizania palustris TaxID=103762 RepID=A0A8J5W1B0_ZIZPA|nr:hypothetical protein GUJ93_ZPchr0010g7855 [Zizania palustris]